MLGKGFINRTDVPGEVGTRRRGARGKGEYQEKRCTRRSGVPGEGVF